MRIFCCKRRPKQGRRTSPSHADLPGAAEQGAGLAFRISEAGYRLDIPRVFAALALVSAAGVVIYAALTALTRLSLGRWHESARGRGE